MKKKLPIVVLIAILAVACVGTVVTYANIQHSEFLLAGETAADTADGDVYATVNGRPVYQGQVERAMQTEELMYESSLQLIEIGGYLTEEEMAEYEAAYPPPTQEEVEQRLLREALLTGLAEERGLSVTEEEAREYADNINETLEAMEAEGDASAQYMLDSLETYAAGMGMTYEEYTEEILVPTWRDALLRDKLYDQVIAEAAQSPSAQSVDADAQEEIWEAFVAQAMAEAEIVYP